MKEGRFNLLAAAIIDCERRIFISCLIRLTVVAMTTGIFLSIFFSLIQSHVEMQYNSKWAVHCTSSPLPAKFTRQRNFSLVVLIFNVHRSIAQQTNSTPTANGERRWEEEDKSTCNWLSVERVSITSCRNDNDGSCSSNSNTRWGGTRLDWFTPQHGNDYDDSVQRKQRPLAEFFFFFFFWKGRLLPPSFSPSATLSVLFPLHSLRSLSFGYSGCVLNTLHCNALNERSE